MLSMKEFFQGVLHTEGFICLVGIKNKKVKTVFVDNIDEAVKVAKEIDKNGFDTYFACATFKEKTNRTVENALGIRTFFIDLDCGTGKPYSNQEEALTALLKFCREEKINLPLIVNSGGGIHAYWPIEETLEIPEWRTKASAFKDFLNSKHLHADPAVTGDAARILRVPETSNYKTSKPRRVSILANNKGFFNWTYSEPQSDLKLNYQTEPDTITQALIGNIEASFKKILSKTLKGEGCGQIKRIAEDQEGIGEPLWRAGLSVAQFCTDRNVAIHAISSNYHGYSAEETDRKASQIKGPYTCATFESLNPGGCDGCALKGKITSPIQIGKVVKEYKGEGTAGTSDGNSGTAISIPRDFPKGYFRGQNGGIYRRVTKGEEVEDFLIYEHDMFVTKRFYDMDKGDVIEVNLKLPHDDLRTFLMPMRGLMAKEGVRQEFASRGVALVTKYMDWLVEYIIGWANHLQRKERAEMARLQMGWTPENHFVLGDIEITPAGNKWTPPSPSTLNVVSAIGQKGTLEEWDAILNEVYGREGTEAQAFALLAGIGAVLFKWTNLEGVVLNLLSRTSGTGKSTLCYAINSTYGHPRDLLLTKADTFLFTQQRIGIMCNLPVTVDEITNWTPETASEFAYGITQGRGKHRMKNYANEERMNITKWSTIAVTTSNASLYDKLNIIKKMPEGEMYRIFEIFIQSFNQMSKEEGDKILHKLSDNYGQAGMLFLDFVVKNLTAVKAKVLKVRADFDRVVNMTPAERNWSALMACAFTTGMIFKSDLGLLKAIDLDKVYEYMIQTIQEVRKNIRKIGVNGSSLLGQYLNEIYSNVLVIDNAIDKRNQNMNRAALKEPKGELLVRVEPDTRKGYITAGHFRKYCGDQQIPYVEILKNLIDRGIILRTEKKRMGKGTSINTPPVEALVIDCNHPEFAFELPVEDETTENKNKVSVGSS